MENENTLTLSAKQQEKPLEASRRLLVGLLFKKFKDYYPGKCDPVFDDPVALPELIRVWAEDLKSFSPDEIKSGIDQLKFSGFEWPPGLSKFVNLIQQNPNNDRYKHLPLWVAEEDTQEERDKRYANFKKFQADVKRIFAGKKISFKKAK